MRMCTLHFPCVIGNKAFSTAFAYNWIWTIQMIGSDMLSQLRCVRKSSSVPAAGVPVFWLRVGFHLAVMCLRSKVHWLECYIGSWCPETNVGWAFTTKWNQLGIRYVALLSQNMLPPKIWDLMSPDMDQVHHVSAKIDIEPSLSSTKFQWMYQRHAGYISHTLITRLSHGQARKGALHEHCNL